MIDYSPCMMGGFNELMMWSSFEVDALEMQHNNSVYTYNCSPGGGIQGNRNPFVDYPELVNYVFGSLKDLPGSLNHLRPSKQWLFINNIGTFVPDMIKSLSVVYF